MPDARFSAGERSVHVPALNRARYSIFLNCRAVRAADRYVLLRTLHNSTRVDEGGKIMFMTSSRDKNDDIYRGGEGRGGPAL